MSTITTTTRNAGLEDMVALLKDQHARRIDVVAAASQLRMVDGMLRVKGSEPMITEDGVTSTDGMYVPNGVFDEGVAAKLSIPLTWVRKMRADVPDLYDTTVNRMLHGRKPLIRGGETVREAVPGDPRSFMVRAYRGDDGPGVARAFMSDRYEIIDNLDVLMATLEGVQQAGVEVDIDGCDLSERRMYVRIVAPQLKALAPALLDGYVSPYGGARGAENPTVFAGFILSNSEVGNGAFKITPRLVVQICNNGMTINADAVKDTHVGGRLESGVVRYASDTQATNLTLIKQQARDAVATFLDVDYMTRVIRDMEAKAGTPVEDKDTVTNVAKSLKFTETQTESILDHFIAGRQQTKGGIMHAITAAAQEDKFDPDTRAEMESAAVKALDVRV
jgi:hypothetical protein